CQQAMVERVSLCFDAFFPASNAWYENYVYPTTDGLSLYWRDITDRKRVEARLAYHAYLLDHIHDAVIATDERLIITAWNKGAERLYGWAADEATGRHIWDIVPVDLSDEQRAEAVQNLEERSQFRTEAATYRKDGAPV